MDMKKYALFFILTAFLLAGLSSCKPEEIPKKPDSGIVDPKPNPNPEPTPNPDPEPNPGPTPVEESVVYYDNLDKVKSEGNGNYFNTWTDGRNMEGSGIEGVSYDGSYTSVRSSYASMGYPGASGLNGVYYSQNGSNITVRGIVLPTDKRTYKLSVGFCVYDRETPKDYKKAFKIEISDEHGKKSHILDCTIDKYGSWYLAKSVFEVTSSETTKLNIKIEALADGVQGRTDDLRLVTTTETASVQYDFGHSGTPDPGPEPSLKDYIERPATLKSNSDYKYVDHRAKTYKTKQNVRNYEACYDIRRHNPMWVAYPCHEIYWEGGYTRPKPDPWRPDPKFSESEQSIIYASDWADWPWGTVSKDDLKSPNDKYQYWSGVSTGKYTTRGHLMRSAERGAGKWNNLFKLNEQTFYPTNIAPELYKNVDTDGNSHWDMVEGILPNKWRCSDTIYVVVGCWYDNDEWKLFDAVSGYDKSDKSKECIMPKARYKLVLRTKSGNTGKPIWQCSADEVMAIGFWFPQSFTGEKLSSLPPLADYIYSVSDIEKKIGSEFNFFPLAPEGVKDSYNINDWPGLSDIAGSSTQSSYSGVTTEEFNPGGKVSW